MKNGNNNIANTFLLDIHTHSLVSGHAYGTIHEMAYAAK